MDPLVTIVITSYNYGKHVGDAIASALNQTYRNIEVLVVDNASTDNSLEVIRSFEDDRLRVVVHPENIGFQKNHNSGVQLAGGEYLLFLSADDMLLPTMVEDAVEQIRLHPEVDVTYASVAIMDADRNIDYYFDHPSFDGADSYWGRNEFASLLTRDNCMYFPTTLFAKRLFDELGLLDEHLGAVIDYEWCIRLAGAGKRFAFISKPGALIRFHGDNRSGVKRFVATGNQLREFCYVLEKYTQPQYHEALAGYQGELLRMMAGKVNEMRVPFPAEYEAQRVELEPLVERTIESIRTVPALSSAAANGEGLVSVVIPFRGRIGHLQRALQSLRNQDYENWEAIIVSDGTFDPSGIVDWLGLRDRVRISRVRGNRGPGFARNLGIGGANGEIICYLDEDNRFEPGYLSELARQFADSTVNVTAGRALLSVVDRAGNTLATTEPDFGTLSDGIVSVATNKLPLNAVAHRRSCLYQAGLFHAGLPLLEDMEFLIRLNRAYAFKSLDRIACIVCIEVGMGGHHVFGRTNSAQWTEYLARLQDIYAAYPARNDLETQTRERFVSTLQQTIQQGVNGRGDVSEIAQFAMKLAGVEGVKATA